MGRTIPQGIKPPFRQLPVGMLLFDVRDVQTGTLESTGKNGTKFECKVIQAGLVIVEPKEFAGVEHDETFFIGTEDDPFAEKDETWVARAGRYDEFCFKAGVECQGQDEDVVMSNLRDHRVIGNTIARVEPEMKKGQPNPYAGRTRTNIRQWFAVGEQEVHAEVVPMTAPATTAPVGATIPGPRPAGPRVPAAPAGGNAGARPSPGPIRRLGGR